jgi:L-ascorbate metabolism protein UlaG (beta-lactamase superfamily)
MKLHHLRNATFIIEAGANFILVDPMLGGVGYMPPFSFIRFKPQKNPTVQLPQNYKEILNKVTHCLITHRHPDHIDSTAIQFLVAHNIPVTCGIKDVGSLKKRGVNIVQSLKYWEKDTFLEGSITGIPAKHGYGFMAFPMGNVIGFHIVLPDHPSIYISADTIYTNDVEKVLTELKPDISVLAAGSAQFDIGRPVLMDMKDIIRFVIKSPKKVMANHLEAINHCPTTRAQLKRELSQRGLLDKVYIPNDGDTISL